MPKREYVVRIPVTVTVNIDLPENVEFSDSEIIDCAMSCITQNMQTDSGCRRPLFDPQGNPIGNEIIWADIYSEKFEEDCEIEREQ